VVELRDKAADIDLLWQSGRQRVPAGRYVEPVATAQGSFLDYFDGGWQELFPNAGFACEYEGASLGQDGKVAMLPWSVNVIRDDSAEIKVTFTFERVRMPFVIDLRQVLEPTAATNDLFEDLPDGFLAVRNPGLGVGLALRWDRQVFPFVWCWQAFGGMHGYPGWKSLYYLSVQPAPGPFGTLVDGIPSGRAPCLKAGVTPDPDDSACFECRNGIAPFPPGTMTC
jgi:hypothetical protein